VRGSGLAGLDLGNGTTDGGIVATASDLGRFIEALLTRRSFPSPGEHARFLRRLLPRRPGGNTLNMDNYGLGICGIDTPLGLAYAHGGHTFGYIAQMLYFPEVGVSVGLLVNDDRVETAPAYQSLLTRLFEVLARETGRKMPAPAGRQAQQRPSFVPSELMRTPRPWAQ
jgi:CubicO group peptidase (beta-lactamase class C family)